MNRDPKKKPEQKQHLPSITKDPVHEHRSTHRFDKLSALRLSKGRLSAGGEACSEIPESLWSNLSVETTHLSRESYSTGQNHGSAVSSPSNGHMPVMNAHDGPSEARRAKEGASADSAEERKDTTGVTPWRLHETQRVLRCIWITRSKLN